VQHHSSNIHCICTTTAVVAVSAAATGPRNLVKANPKLVAVSCATASTLACRSRPRCISSRVCLRLRGEKEVASGTVFVGGLGERLAPQRLRPRLLLGDDAV
jgi:hypothetical protein